MPVQTQWHQQPPTASQLCGFPRAAPLEAAPAEHQGTAQCSGDRAALLTAALSSPTAGAVLLLCRALREGRSRCYWSGVEKRDLQALVPTHGMNRTARAFTETVMPVPSVSASKQGSRKTSGREFEKMEVGKCHALLEAPAPLTAPVLASRPAHLQHHNPPAASCAPALCRDGGRAGGCRPRENTRQLRAATSCSSQRSAR